MIKEQEEAIEKCREIIEKNNNIVKEAQKSGDINAMHLVADLDKESIRIETVLNMLKEKDKEIEKKDKIIDLMVDSFQQICVTPNLAKYWWKRICKGELKICEGRLCEDCIKEYFERKASE